MCVCGCCIHAYTNSNICFLMETFCSFNVFTKWLNWFVEYTVLFTSLPCVVHLWIYILIHCFGSHLSCSHRSNTGYIIHVSQLSKISNRNQDMESCKFQAVGVGRWAWHAVKTTKQLCTQQSWINYTWKQWVESKPLP